MGRVVAVCIGRKKGTVKKPVRAAEFKPDYGIVGDAHAGMGPRQVSMLAEESINEMRATIPNLSAGAFAENIVTIGINYASVAVGDRIILGNDIILEVYQLGKECHSACAIQRLSGDCIMPREGLFCRVLRGGRLKPGDTAVIQARTTRETPQAYTSERSPTW
ncbi:MAG: MOSC domain-containing protein [Fidelibacterota bacterium]|nr:MAG: MOSC domain-containing protein [Candidatus Neomarinimicrobiota bacterium]